MAKSAMIRARIEPELKAEVEAILEEVGLSPTDAISMFYRQIALQRGIPFELKIPNKKTEKALRESLAGKGLETWASLDEMRRALG